MDIVHEKLLKKNYQNTELSNLDKKRALLVRLKQYILKLSKMYIDNVFT